MVKYFTTHPITNHQKQLSFPFPSLLQPPSSLIKSNNKITKKSPSISEILKIIFINNKKKTMKTQTPLLPLTNPYLGSSSPLTKRQKLTLPTNTMFFNNNNNTNNGLSTTHLLINDDDKGIGKSPLLSKEYSFGGGSGGDSKTRIRGSSEDENASLCNSDQQSFASNVEHAASEINLLSRLSLKLLAYLGVGYRWITRFLALGCYAILLMPGFIQVGYHYFFSRHVRRSIVYGDQPRNRLDLYVPKEGKGPYPVVAFVTGGAWIIGYKAWGSLLGLQLSERGIMVACIDYRNFPQGTMKNMIEDASNGIAFVCNNIAEYGGDPNRIYVMGQSAGAHISACTLVEQAIKEAGEGESVSWSLSQIKAYFGLSGGYNLLNLVDHFHNRGLYRSIFLGIMEGEQSLQQYSPELVIQDPNVKSAAKLLPPIILFHGTADYSIPCDASKDFADTLRGLGVKAEAILYEGKTHTDVFLQDPMRGGKDQMFEDLVGYIHAGDEEALAKDAVAPPRKRLVPECMLKLAHAVSPF